MSTNILERWVRRIFVEDWSLKLLALAITLVLWFVISGHDVEREINVKPVLVGKPAPSYEIKSVTATPTHVRVQGPAGSVSALQEVFSEKISVDGRRESFDALHTAVYTSDSRVEVLDTVSIHVDIGAAGKQGTNLEKTN